MNKALLISFLILVSPVLYAQQAEAGKTIYTRRCITCHQADGSGAQNMIPPLIGTDYVLGDKAQLIKILLIGMSGEIEVNGDRYSGEMPSQKDLTDAEIAAVLTYIRSSFGNGAGPVTDTEVKKVRDETIR